ncbi:MAG: hypothetical protein DMG51_12760 [Acidobacteria bacterium]|nr:MAG: hypothetical protein DMG51_12760 [Acidobacteriota bacterium]
MSSVLGGFISGSLNGVVAVLVLIMVATWRGAERFDTALEKDYKKMRVMIFGEQPPFGWILERLSARSKTELNK